jgi:UDP:flavonoid glycosyltransferase YjiC (YdhE family)
VRSNLPELEEFLSTGDRPWVFTAGSVNMHAHDFFRAAVDACKTAGRRGLLIARFAEQIPSSLPATVRHFEYVPFSQVLTRAAAFSHHGGIGTMAQALAVGTPQLVMPLAHDQFDNAVRVRRLGVGDFVLPKNFTGAAVADSLMRLTTSRETEESAKKCAALLKATTPLETTCNLLESCAGPV